MQRAFFAMTLRESVNEDSCSSRRNKFVRFVDELDVNQREPTPLQEEFLNVTNSTSTLPASAIKFLRRRDVLQTMAISESEMYRRLHAGLFVAPVSYGARMKVWPANEVWALADAYLSGKSEDEIRALVAEMKEARHAGI